MPYVAGRHQIYNGKVYEAGEVMDLTDETMARIESYTYSKVIKWVDEAPAAPVVDAPKPKKAKKADVVETPAPVVDETPVVEEPTETPAE